MMETLRALVTGHLSDHERVVTALWPLALLGLWVAGGLIAYASRNRRLGRFRDPEMESRGASALLGMRLRLFFSWLMVPVWKALLRGNVPANAITLLSVLLAAGAGIAAADGRFALGGWLYLATGLCDFLDGRLARESGSDGPRGAVLDSVVDRYVEGALLVGLCWFYRDSTWVLAALLALTGSFLVPYVRARAEGAGAVMANVGLMQRAERVVVLGFTTAIAPAVDVITSVPPEWPQHVLSLGALAFLAVSSHLTAVQRLVFAMKALPGKVFRPPTVNYKIRRGASVILELAALALLVSMGVPWAGGAFLAATMGLSVAGADRDWYGLTMLTISSAVLVVGGVWLLGSTSLMPPALSWFAARLAVHLFWIVPNELPRHLVDREPSPPTAST